MIVLALMAFAFILGAAVGGFNRQPNSPRWMVLMQRLREMIADVTRKRDRDRLDPEIVYDLVEVLIAMADQIAQLTADVAAQKALVASTLTDVSSAITGLQASVASLTAQLAAIGTGGTLPDISQQLADIESDTATLQTVKDAADAAIATLTPPAAPSGNTTTGNVTAPTT